MTNPDALIIFAKSPLHGGVKTRLSPYLTARERQGFYECMLKHTVHTLRCLPATDVFICYHPKGAEQYFRCFGLGTFVQAGQDLGERMLNAVALALEHKGYQRAVIVGSDIPEISCETVARGFALLEGADVVFGPTMDGGYYMVGLSEPVQGLFTGMQWSTEAVLGQSLRRAEALGLGIALAPELSDIDTIEDLIRAGIVLDDGGRVLMHGSPRGERGTRGGTG